MTGLPSISRAQRLSSQSDLSITLNIAGEEPMIVRL